MAGQIRLTREQALPKIRHYCAYQERTHQEVRDKLYSFGLYKTDVEQVLTQLIEENFLDEERFAIQYAGGKFRVRQWGKIKIAYALKSKNLSAWCIRKALGEIPDDDYEKTLLKLATRKWDTLGGETRISKEVKTRAYLLQKGYEQDLITIVIRQIASK